MYSPQAPNRVWQVDQIERYREYKTTVQSTRYKEGLERRTLYSLVLCFFVLCFLCSVSVPLFLYSVFCTLFLYAVFVRCFCALFFVLCFLYSVFCTLFLYSRFLFSVFCTLFLYSVFCSLFLYSVFFPIRVKKQSVLLYSGSLLRCEWCVVLVQATPCSSTLYACNVPVMAPDDCTDLRLRSLRTVDR